MTALAVEIERIAVRDPARSVWNSADAADLPANGDHGSSGEISREFISECLVELERIDSAAEPEFQHYRNLRRDLGDPPPSFEDSKGTDEALFRLMVIVDRTLVSAQRWVDSISRRLRSMDRLLPLLAADAPAVECIRRRFTDSRSDFEWLARTAKQWREQILDEIERRGMGAAEAPIGQLDLLPSDSAFLPPVL